MARQYPNMAKTIMHNQNQRMSQMNKIMKGPKGQPLPGPGNNMRLPGGAQGSMPPSSMPRTGMNMMPGNDGPPPGAAPPGGPPSGGPDPMQGGEQGEAGDMGQQGKALF